MPQFSRYEELVRRVKEKYPRFNVKYRDKSWLFPIFWLLSKITGTNYDGFTTTIFSTMYVGPTWSSKSDEDKYRSLRHELVHIEQAHNWPLGRWAWPVNHFLWALSYIFCFPVLLTFRAKFEREGYAATMLVEYELYGKFEPDKMVRWAEWMERTFGTGVYFFMWRKKAARKWAMKMMAAINAGKHTSDIGYGPWTIPGPEDSEAPRSSA